MFSRFFKPRWQHTNANIRERAIAGLNPTSDAVALATLARGDTSAAVRTAAVRRLTDLKLLDQVIQRDSDAAVREVASLQVQALLAGVLPGLSLENRLRVIGLTDNQPVLAAVARDGIDSATRLAAANRIHDQASLMTLALDGADAELRISVAARLTDPDNLRRLARDGRDKKVVRMAREQLKQQQQHQYQQQQHQQRAEELIDYLQAHLKRPFDNLYAARLQQLSQSWTEVTANATEQQCERAAAVIQQCQQRIDEWHQQNEQEKQRHTALAELVAAADTLQESLKALADAEEWQPANSLSALLASQQRRWQEACDIVSAEAPLADRYQQLEQQWLALIEHWRRADEHGLVDNWPDSLPRPPALRTVVASAAAPAEPQADTKPGKRKQDDIDRTLNTLQSALRQRQLRFANRLWHKLEQLEQEISDQQQARMEKLRPQLDELRDWHAFAAEPKKISLCEQMEQLIDSTLPAKERADVIQLLQSQWRKLMTADQQSDQALWDRFRAAADAAWIPCREHFAELDRERADNLNKRIALCDQLGQYIESLQGNNDADWAAVAEVRRTAPQEWSRYQPVRFTDARDLSKQFSAQLKQLDELLDQAAATNIASLESLIAEAETLASDDDSRQAAEQIKALQKRWQQAGWVPVNAQRQLYKRFRKLADQVFARRQDQQTAQRQQAAAEAAQLRDKLTELEQLVRDAGDDNAMKLLAQLAEEVAAMPCSRREEKLLQLRDNLIRESRQRRQRWPQWQRWSAMQQRLLNAATRDEDEHQQQLAVAMEVSAGLESPETAREQRMQWQLQQLSQAMKSTSVAPADRCHALLEESDVLDQGLSESIRHRLLAVWNTLEPRA